MKEKRHILYNSFMTFAVFMTIICLAVTLVLVLVPLYRLAAVHFKLPEKTGYSLDVIMKNYKVLIRYNMLWGKEPLSFPDFASSPSGLVHFQDVRQLFKNMQIMGLLGIPVCYLGYRAGKRMRALEWMKWTCVFTLAVIAVLSVSAVINARATFVFMHKILFTNVYWAFNAKKDPIILILPEEIFLAAAIEMGVFILIGLAVLLVRYGQLKSTFTKKYKTSGIKKVSSGKDAKSGR